MSDWEIEYYTTASGRCPVQDYLDAQSATDAAAVTAVIDLLASTGLALSAPHVRQVEGKLWELRAKARRLHRVFYFAAHGRRFVLLHGYTKQGQKAPKREIQTAQQRLADYEARREKGR